MKQSSLDLNLSNKKTRKQELLVQMEIVTPWAALVELILKAGTAVDATLIAAPSAQRYQEQGQKARSRDALQPKGQ